MHDLGLILQKELWMIKNYLVQIKNNPKRLILMLVYIAWFAYMIFINGDHQSHSSFDEYFTNGMILFIIAITLFINSKNALNDMTNAFQMGDVNLLFTSPIDSKIILLSTLIKKFFVALFTSVFILIFFFSRANTESLTLATVTIGLYGYISFAFMLEPLNFLVLKLSKRINILWIQSVLIGLFLVPLLAIFLMEGSYTGVLVSDTFHMIPFYGFSKALILTLFYGVNQRTYYYLIFQTILLILVTTLAVYHGTDYYEDVLQSSSSFACKREKTLKGNNEKSAFSFFLNRNVAIDDKNTSHKAFYWKAKQEYSKMDFHYLFGLQTMGLLILSISVTVLSHINSDFHWLPYAINSAFAYVILLMTMGRKIKEEYEHPFFFILPGTFSEKLYQCKKLDLSRFFVNTLVLNVPFIFASDIIVPIVLMMIFALNLIFWNLMMSNLLIKIFFTDQMDYAVSLPLRKLLQMFVLIVPSLVAATGATLLNLSAIQILVALVLGNLLADLLLLMLSGKLVSRMEYYG